MSFYSTADVRRVRRKLARLGLRLRTEQASNCSLSVTDPDGRRVYLGGLGGGIAALEQWVDASDTQPDIEVPDDDDPDDAA
jgi:hypothetical protein